MKKLFALMFSLLIIITVCCGCGTSASTDVVETKSVTEETQAQTEAPTEPPTEPPTEAKSKAGLYVSELSQSSLDLADYVEIKDDKTVTMQFNLLEAMVVGYGTYSANDVGVLTFSDIVAENGLVIVESGAQFYPSDVDVMMITGVEERFALQGWNAPIPYHDSNLFICAD